MWDLVLILPLQGCGILGKSPFLSCSEFSPSVWSDGVTLKVTALEFYDLINLRASAFIEEEDCEEVFEPQFPPQQNVSRHGVKGPLHV